MGFRWSGVQISPARPVSPVTQLSMGADSERAMERCSRCLETKLLAAFAFTDCARGILQSRCRACFSATNRFYYERNPERYKAHASHSKPTTLLGTKDALRDYLLAHPCQDCGETDIAVLE